MGLNKYLNFFLAGIACVFAFLYYTHSCPVCPLVSSNSSVIIDTIVVHDTVSLSKIHLTKIVKPKDENVTANFSQAYYDSIADLFNSEYFSQVDISDSLMQGSVSETISQNRITSFTMEKKYFLPTKTDSIIQKVFVPQYKNCVTLGLFAGKASGVNIGYRFKGNHASAGYDVINKGVVFNFNFDLK